MGIFQKVRGWIEMHFGSKVRRELGVKSITSQKMDAAITQFAEIYKGNPPWENADDSIFSIDFAKAVCSETARLATLAIGIEITGSARADWLKEQIDSVLTKIRHWVEFGCAYGTIILKPNGESVDIFTPDQFVVTDQKNGEITGVVFVNQETLGDRYYTRLEYHRFTENGLYAVTNKCYVGDTGRDIGKPVPIEATPWNGMLEDVWIEMVEQPLFGVFRTPQANNIDLTSPLGIAVFSDAIEELKDLDVAYSRNAKEIVDSKRTVLLDSDKLMVTGQKISSGAKGFELAREAAGLPDYVKNVYGNGSESFYQEINPTLNTETRWAGINALLGQIGYKCGFSNGYFVFNEKTGFSTATQVEADQQRTIQFIKDVRDKLRICMDDLIYALDKFADLYGYAPVGVYEVEYNFGDITYTYETDKQTWYSYVTQGKIPFWYYLVKFEGMNEEEAKALEEAAQPKEPTLFG